MKLTCKKYSIWLFFLFCSVFAYSQNENSKWYFGINAGVDFAASPPTVLTNGQTTTFEGSASIADASGNLLFYTDGMIIWNSLHVPMANGTGLLGNNSTTQAALIVKQPASTHVYYVFTLDNQGWANGFRYSVVDMNLAAGNGSVTLKNIPLSVPSTEKLTGTRHCNGVDFWIVVHDSNTTNFRSYFLSSAGLNTTPVISSVGSLHTSTQGSMKMAPNGRKLALTIFNGTPSTIELFDFDNTNGQVSNPLVLTNSTGNYYGCEFSPDASKLYGTSVGPPLLYQWNLCAGSSTAIIASQYSIPVSSTIALGYMQLAPDGKVYVARSYQQVLGAISSPDALGPASNYNALALSIGSGTCQLGLPNLITGFSKPAVSSFSHSPASACQSTSFTAPSLAACSGYSFTSMVWNFGDPSSTTNTSTLSNPTHNYTSLGTYSVQLILKYCCCILNDTLTSLININQSCLSVSSTSITCANWGSSSVTVVGSAGPFTYSWLPTSQSSSIATGLYPGTYTVLVHDLGANITNSLSITFTSPIPFTGNLVISNTVVCNGVNNGAASVTNINGGTGNNLFWWGNGLSTFTSSSGSVSSLGPGTWTVITTDLLSGCFFSYTFTIGAYNSPTLTVSPLVSDLCAGMSLALHAASNGTLVTWLPATGLNTVNGFSVLAAPGTSQIYTVTAQVNGCMATATVFVNIIALPTLTINTLKNKYCRNELIELTGMGAESYSWSTEGGNLASGQTVTFNVNNQPFNGNYSLTGMDAHGCKSTIGKLIKINELPQASLSSSIMQACVPFCSEIQFIKSPKDSAIKFLNWQVETLFFYTKNFNYCFNTPGNIEIITSFMDTLTSCTNTQVISITAWKKPVADFYFTPEKPVEQVDEVMFGIKTDESELKNWDWEMNIPNSISIANKTKSFYKIFENAGNYPVALIVEDEHLCKDTMIRVVVVEEDFLFYIPNVFSPNDDQLNDIFIPVTRATKELSLQIFDRWGEKLFEINKPGEGWDGNFRGKPCKQDVYVWKLKVVANNPAIGEKLKQGEVLLIR